MKSSVDVARTTLAFLLQKAQEHPSTASAERDSFTLKPNDWAILSTSGNALESLSQVDRNRNAELLLGAFVGFFQCATDGYALVPVDRIREQYGRPLQENYPEASAPFLKFARTYWTLKIVHHDLALEQPEMMVTHLLGEVEKDVASVFFPTPGPVNIPAAQRESKQREMLGQFAPGIDIEQFVRGNPILIRDRSSVGCFGVVLVLLVNFVVCQLLIG